MEAVHWWGMQDRSQADVSPAPELQREKLTPREVRGSLTSAKGVDHGCNFSLWRLGIRKVGVGAGGDGG